MNELLTQAEAKLYMHEACAQGWLCTADFRYPDFSLDFLVPSWTTLSNEFLPALNFQQPCNCLTWPSHKLKHPDSLLPETAEKNSVAKDYPDLASPGASMSGWGLWSEPISILYPPRSCAQKSYEADLSTLYLLTKTIVLHNSHAESGPSPTNKWIRN